MKIVVDMIQPLEHKEIGFKGYLHYKTLALDI